MQLLHSHNLRAIYNKIVTVYSLHVDSRACKWLGDFYFDARYPGDNFVVVSREDAEECIRLVELIKQDVTAILEEDQQRRIVQHKKLEEFKAFP